MRDKYTIVIDERRENWYCIAIRYSLNICTKFLVYFKVSLILFGMTLGIKAPCNFFLKTFNL